jgi:hypothetical protein
VPEELTRGTEKIKGFDFPSDFASRKEKIILAETGWSGVVTHPDTRANSG